MKWLFYYCIFINIIAMVIYGLDKLLAIFNKRRVRELYLHLLSAFGGVLGCLIGMMLFKHKIRKMRFYVWNIIMFIFWIYILYMMYY